LISFATVRPGTLGTSAFDSINEFSKETVFFELLCAFFIALGYPVLKPFFKLLNVTLDRS
jgi:hypothetical protein